MHPLRMYNDSATRTTSTSTTPGPSGEQCRVLLVGNGFDDRNRDLGMWFVKLLSAQAGFGELLELRVGARSRVATVIRAGSNW